jgi:iron complex outermembrane recepter protein
VSVLNRWGDKLKLAGQKEGSKPVRGRKRFLLMIRLFLRAIPSVGFALLVFLAMASPGWPQEKSPDLTNQSLEDLMNVEVISVSKKEQKLSQTASAIFVINSEDIRRSGATNIPDLLRMVPGMDVAQINSNTWAITARAFNGKFSNELLVLVDGRTVYTPTFGGVFWDVLDIPLEDIERIEVIRGPGGSVWGTNAVNGVVNIITKKAADTKGAIVEALAGNLDQGSGTVQYGGTLGKLGDFRTYVKYFNQVSLPGPTGRSGSDGWHLLRGGFRIDSTISPKDTLTVQGDIYTGEEGDPTIFLPSITSPAALDIESQVPLSGGFLQTIWNHTYSRKSDTTLQFSYDQYERNDVLNEERNTFNTDFQNHIAWGGKQDIVWGLSYRFSASRSNGGLTFSLFPANLSTQVFGAFFQDEITIVPNQVFLTVGSKLEHDHFAGFNLEPSARIAWAPTDHQMMWAAISQADRVPAATDTDARLNFGGFTGSGGTPTAISLFGNPHFKDEDVIAFEMGYRTTVFKNLSMDFAAYFGDYTNQETIEPATPFFENTPAPPHLVLPLTYENLMHGETHGFEVAANWKAANRWTLSPGFDLGRIHMHSNPNSQDTGSVGDAEGSTPRESAQLRSHVNLSGGIGWDVSAYFVNRIPNLQVASYTRLDTGLSWQWKKSFVVSLAGQNLLKNEHLEYVDSSQSVRSTLIKRSGYVKLTWRY